MIRWFLYLGLLLSTATVGADGQKRCLLVYSYHVGYPWNDAVDQGATEILQGECEIHRFYMDSKRNPDPQFIEKKARQAHAVIEQWKPDVVLAIDDNSSKYLVAPYLKDHAIPVVFAGVNWTVSEYGYPFSNVTGMIEVAPIAPLFLHAERILRSGSRQQLDVHVIDANRYSAYKEYDQIKSHFGGAEMQFHPHFVATGSKFSCPPLYQKLIDSQ